LSCRCAIFFKVFKILKFAVVGMLLPLGFSAILHSADEYGYKSPDYSGKSDS
jgi:hypothetical protein